MNVSMFNPSQIPNDAILAIVGVRRSGKTHLASDLARHIKPVRTTVIQDSVVSDTKFASCLEKARLVSGVVIVEMQHVCYARSQFINAHARFIFIFRAADIFARAAYKNCLAWLGTFDQFRELMLTATQTRHSCLVIDMQTKQVHQYVAPK